jgi:hypothetical protein
MYYKLALGLTQDALGDAVGVFHLLSFCPKFASVRVTERMSTTQAMFGLIKKAVKT